jgi:rhodanese-related sulfurtransferase
MSNRARARTAVALIALLALFAASCSDDTGDETTTPTTEAVVSTVAPATTEAPPMTEATATTVVETYDLVAAVDQYAASIPEGFSVITDVTAFKDALTAGAFVIDVREPSEYAEGHIEGAINIPLRELGANLDKIPTDRQVFVHCASGYRAGMALSSLGMMGYDNVVSFFPGYQGWVAAGEPVTTEVPTIETFTVPGIPTEMFTAVNGFLSTIPEGWLSAGDAAKVNDAIGAGAFMLDVREPSEYTEGHIPGAANIPLRELAARFGELPTDQQVIAYCKSGHRQAMSVPMLHVLGNETAEGFPASFLGWTDAGLPVETS